MKKVTTRFAPSPSGKLHIGNVRVALINYLYAKKNNGEFILRIDDTDSIRSENKYKDSILEDLNWLNLKYDKIFYQSNRIYKDIKNYLIFKGRLYPCYETQSELNIKRKTQLSNNKPPIYDRASLKLTKQEISKYEQMGRKPHYRFLIEDKDIVWNDMVKGEVRYNGQHMSDPILIREDGSMTYMLCSVLDDVEFNISHIIRGEDHISNTVTQIQIFEALECDMPIFGHLSLIKTKDKKISKSEGGFDIYSLRNEIDPIALNSFLKYLGSSKSIKLCKDINDLIEDFEIYNYSSRPVTYISEDIFSLNQKLISNYSFEEIKTYLDKSKIDINEKIWLVIRDNIKTLSEIDKWCKILNNPKIIHQDTELLSIALDHLPKEINNITYKEWIKNISKISSKTGPNIFIPLRLALTGESSGPELKNILSCLPREEISKRLKYSS